MAGTPFRTNVRVVRTVGEILADGSVLELVTSTSPGGLAFLFRNADRKIIAPQIEYSGLIYQPPELDETTRRAIRFPHEAKSYGSTAKLLQRIQQLFELYAGLTQRDSALMTAWVASSWFPDCLSSPPTLLISGPDAGHAITLFRVLHCLCRRPVVLGDLNRKDFLSLASLGATLLINQPSLSARIRDLWSTSNYRGVYVLGNGKVCSVAGSKASFLGMADVRGGDDIHFALPPAPCDLPLLNEQEQYAIAEELQPQLLMYRLRNFDKVRNFRASTHSPAFAGSEVARNLAACVLGETEILQLMAPLLRGLEQDEIARRRCDVHLAMIEVTWAPSHGDREMNISRLTALTNALLRCRGENLEYSPAEIGWKLKNFGFPRHRNGRGMVLRFSDENRLLIHRLAVRWSLSLPAFASCAHCSSPEVVVEE